MNRGVSAKICLVLLSGVLAFGSAYAQGQPLYRMSKHHGGIYCSACHDSTHAIAPSREPNDAIKYIELQGRSGTLAKCTVCHSRQPLAAGPHGIVKSIINPGIILPLLLE